MCLCHLFQLVGQTFGHSKGIITIIINFEFKKIKYAYSSSLAISSINIR